MSSQFKVLAAAVIIASGSVIASAAPIGSRDRTHAVPATIGAIDAIDIKGAGGIQGAGHRFPSGGGTADKAAGGFKGSAHRFPSGGGTADKAAGGFKGSAHRFPSGGGTADKAAALGIASVRLDGSVRLRDLASDAPPTWSVRRVGAFRLEVPLASDALTIKTSRGLHEGNGSPVRIGGGVSFDPYDESVSAGVNFQF